MWQTQCFALCISSYLEFIAFALLPEVLLQKDEILFDYILLTLYFELCIQSSHILLILLVRSLTFPSILSSWVWGSVSSLFRTVILLPILILILMNTHTYSPYGNVLLLPLLLNTSYKGLVTLLQNSSFLWENLSPWYISYWHNCWCLVSCLHNVKS